MMSSHPKARATPETSTDHPTTSLENDQVNESAWESFTDFISSGNSDGDSSEAKVVRFKNEPWNEPDKEPDADDYIRYGISE